MPGQTDDILYGQTEPRSGIYSLDPELPAWWPQKLDLAKLSLYGRFQDYKDDVWVGAFEWVARAEQVLDEWLPKHFISGASEEFRKEHRHWLRSLAVTMVRDDTDLLDLSQPVNLERRIDQDGIWIGAGTRQHPKVFIADPSRLAAVEILTGSGGEWRYLHLEGEDLDDCGSIIDFDRLIYLGEGELRGNVGLEFWSNS